MKLSQEHVAQAEIVAKLRDNLEMARRQINELNRLVWLLVTHMGGSHMMTIAELENFPKDWKLNITSDPTDKTITFIASTKALDTETAKN